MTNLKNKEVKGYTLQHLIGEGGMAEVWYAENEIGRPAAIKVLRTDLSLNDEVVKRFRTEAKILVNLTHPGIIQVFDIGTLDDRPCIIMEYLDGFDLNKRLKKKEKFSHEYLQNLWNQLADVLNFTHSKKIIHRDIKPSNIFITTKGEVKLLDFGIAKARDTAVNTKTGQHMGSLLFMSPEQIQDPKRVDYRTDLYSLAVTFYNLLTQKAPYDSTSSSDFQIQLKIVTDPLNLDILSPAWNAFLSPYLEKDPAKRPALVHYSDASHKVPEVTCYSVASREETLIEGAQPSPENIEDPEGTPGGKHFKISGKAIGWITIVVVLLTIAYISTHWKGRKITPGADTTIVVSTPNEFLNAIGPDRTIVIKEGSVLHMNDIPSSASGKYYRMDGSMLVIRNVKNMVIRGEGKEQPKLVTLPDNGYVLSFDSCSNITLKNFKAGHEPGTGSCGFGVLKFSNTDNVNIRTCDLYGSGTEGLSLWQTENVTCDSINIHDCSNHIFVAQSSDTLKFRNCQFFNNEGGTFIYNCKSILFSKCTFNDNDFTSGSLTTTNALFYSEKSTILSVDNCIISNNKANYLCYPLNSVTFVATEPSGNNTWISEGSDKPKSK